MRESVIYGRLSTLIAYLRITASVSGVDVAKIEQRIKRNARYLRTRVRVSAVRRICGEFIAEKRDKG